MFGEHLAGGAQSRCNVRVATAHFDSVDGVEQRPTIAVGVQIENDLHFVAELDQSDLRLIFADGERVCDVFSEAEHPLVVVMGLHDNRC